MRTLLSKETIWFTSFTPKWLHGCFAFLVFGQFLDGLTTKIGLDLGLAEVGIYAMPVLGAHGFWGLMAWKYGIIAALGLTYFLVYYGVKKYNPTRLRIVTASLTIGCLVAVIVTFHVDVSNILQIELALRHL